METFQMRSSFGAGSDRRMMSLQWVCENRSIICSGIRFQLRILFRWENLSIILHSLIPAPQRDWLKYLIPCYQQYNIHDFYSLCRGEKLVSACPSPSSAQCKLTIQDPYFLLAPARQVLWSFRQIMQSISVVVSMCGSEMCPPSLAILIYFCGCGCFQNVSPKAHEFAFTL